MTEVISPKFVQIPDDPQTNPDLVRLIASGASGIVPMFSYVILEDSDALGGRRYFLQLTTPNRNLNRFSPQPFDVLTLSQMLAVVEDRGYDLDSLISSVWFYEAEVLAGVDQTGWSQRIFVRPQTGSTGTLATSKEIVQCLGLPVPADQEQARVRVGQLARSGDEPVPVCLTDHVFNHHILAAGATGSGKSHLLSNIAHVADHLGRCVILFDHKPDHQDHHRENPDSQTPRAFNISSDGGRGVVRYWTLMETDPNSSATRLSVSASDLDPEILAGTIFHRQGEDNQAEYFATIVSAYAESHSSWTLHQLIDWIRQSNKNVIEAALPSGVTLHSGSLEAMKRKLYFRGRIPSFVDVQPSRNVIGQSASSPQSVDQVFAPGLNVIRVGEDDSRAYGLFLDRLLAVAAERRQQALQQPQPQGGESFPILVVIDEAADIFQAESRYLRQAATSMLSARIRKGRSLHIGFVIAVQDAGDVPENIRHNLNSTFAGRHRHVKTLREALPTVHESVFAEAGKLEPGQMFAELFGTKSLLVVQADISRSLLTVVK